MGDRLRIVFVLSHRISRMFFFHLCDSEKKFKAKRSIKKRLEAETENKVSSLRYYKKLPSNVPHFIQDTANSLTHN